MSDTLKSTLAIELSRELKKLSEESLTRQPEEVFDILSKLGEGSYGCVYKALHKESQQVLAIKQVPVDTDLQEIIKEISIMQQCDSPYVVKYYGSYFKNTDLWIVMEYCGAGSVLDIMKLRGIHHNLPKGEVKTLTEGEIATILSDTLKGLDYLHDRKKIHRDIKAGNILLNSEGHAKLADFGVAGQLTDTMAKRNTLIGTPFWMAPEVIQEIGYDCVADIWSLGITSLEMAEGKAPYAEIHPMRAIFMIPSKPPPSFSKPDRWSPQFIDFVSRCLVKVPEQRATASELLDHEFITSSSGPPGRLVELIKEAQQMRERLAENIASTSEDHDSSANRSKASIGDGNDDEESGTLVRHLGGDDDDESGGTMIQHATLVPDAVAGGAPAGGAVPGGGTGASNVESYLGTMVINEDEDEEDEDTMKRHDTQDYRPAFLDHFEKKEAEQQKTGEEGERKEVEEAAAAAKETQEQKAAADNLQQQRQQLSSNPQLQKQLEQIAGRPVTQQQQQPQGNNSGSGGGGGDEASAAARFQKSLLEGDLDFLRYLSYEELTARIGNLDQEMEKEIDDLRRRYHAKRQPILDAMDQKRKRQQNF